VLYAMEKGKFPGSVFNLKNIFKNFLKRFQWTKKCWKKITWRAGRNNIHFMFSQLKTPWIIKHNDAKFREIDTFMSNFNDAHQILGIEISVTLEADDLHTG
jgi:hypothetical protein